MKKSEGVKTLTHPKTLAQLVEREATRDWGRAVADHWCGEEDIPSVHALAWLWDFAAAAQSTGLRPPTSVTCSCNHSIGVDWESEMSVPGKHRPSRDMVILTVRWGPSVQGCEPYVMGLTHDCERSFKTIYSPTAEQVTNILGRCIPGEIHYQEEQ